MVLEPASSAGPLRPVVENQLFMEMISACQLVSLAIESGKDLQRALLDVEIAEHLESDEVELRAWYHGKESFGPHEPKLGVGAFVEFDYL